MRALELVEAGQIWLASQHCIDCFFFDTGCRKSAQVNSGKGFAKFHCDAVVEHCVVWCLQSDIWWFMTKVAIVGFCNMRLHACGTVADFHGVSILAFPAWCSDFPNRVCGKASGVHQAGFVLDAGRLAFTGSTASICNDAVHLAFRFRSFCSCWTFCDPFRMSNVKGKTRTGARFKTTIGTRGFGTLRIKRFDCFQNRVVHLLDAKTSSQS